jgi:PKD repeat protein
VYVGTWGFNVVSDRVWINDGTGQFIESEVGVFDDTQSVTLGDVDGDGDLDVFLGNGEEDRILLNNGDGLFGDSGQQFEFAWTTSSVLADIDNDADLDLFVADSDANVVNIWFNEFQQPLIDLLITNDSPVELGNAIYFTSTINSGTNPVYNWDFGDGLSSNSGPNVSHIYDAVGVYTVVLTVHNTISVLTATTNVTVTDIPLSSLTAANSSPTIPGNTTFLTTSLSFGSNAHFFWQFGDGAAGIGANVTHTYSAGVYTAVVTAANSVSSLTATTRILVGYPLTITATSPQGNGSRLLPGVPLSATLNRSYNVNTVNPQSFTVWGKQTGYYTSTFSLFDNTILFDTLPDFKPGEEVFVHLNKKLEATDSIPLTPHVWQFWAPVGVGGGEGGILFNSGQELGASRSQDIALGDVDLDGDLDVFVANGDSRTRLWLNAGNGSFSDSGQLLENRLNMAVALGDLDGDGDLDAFIANSRHEPNTIWLNQGGDQGGALGQYRDSGQLLGELGSYDVALGDLDSDGDLDAFVANVPLWDGSSTNGGFNKIWLNNGRGQFYDGGLESDDRPSYGVALGDLDNDGDLDAFIANRQQPNQVWLNDGTGVFSDTGQLLGNSGSMDVALGDLDNDGDLDAFIANYDDTGVSGSYQPNEVWLNDGSGTFVDSGQTLGADASFGVDLGDLDGDGDLDAIVVNDTYTYFPQNNQIWWNDGNGVFNVGQNMGQRSTCDVAIGDLDNDNDLDAFLANCSANYINQRANQVWLNNDAPVAVSNLTMIHDGPTVIGSATHFTATASGTNINYLWSLGDGTMATGETITHTYSNEGTYLVVVTATNVLNSLTVTHDILVSEPIVGLVAANGGPTILGDTTWFSASVASGENVSYTWDLGDGTVTNGAGITHTYAHTGMFTATVTATNFVNQLITTTTVTIINEPDIPIAGVTAVNDSPTFLGQTTYFTATILNGTNAIYNWSFGDGTFGIGPIVAHIYTNIGTFTATVTVANESNHVSEFTVAHIILPDNNYSIYLPIALKSD